MRLDPNNGELVAGRRMVVASTTLSRRLSSWFGWGSIRVDLMPSRKPLSRTGRVLELP